MNVREFRYRCPLGQFVPTMLDLDRLKRDGWREQDDSLCRPRTNAWTGLSGRCCRRSPNVYTASGRRSVAEWNGGQIPSPARRRPNPSEQGQARANRPAADIDSQGRPA